MPCGHDEEVEEGTADPLVQLGFGIVEYVNILYTMIWTFIIFSVLLIPTIMNFRTGSVYEGDPRGGYANSMIGNLGYSTIECLHIPVSLGKLTLHCSYGHIGQIIDYGINSAAMGSPEDACINNDYNRRCQPSNSSAILAKLKAGNGKASHFVQFSTFDMA